MFRLTCLGLFVVLSIIKGASADWCYAGTYSSYYCYPGQSCGLYYGDCRGLPTYAIIGIISSCIVLLSICIRCCIHMNASNARPPPQRLTIPPHYPGQPPYQVHSFHNNLATVRPQTAVPVHNIREDAPPAYTTIISETTPQAKY